MSITRLQIARQLMAGGGRMSETAASYSSPTARAADDRFSPASDSGNGGGNDTQPTIPTDYFTPSKTKTNIARTANFLLNPKLISKILMDDKIKEDYEEESKVAKDVAMVNLSGSPYFGPINKTAMQSYKNVVGGFPTTPPPTNIGGDGDIIPRFPIICLLYTSPSPRDS